jgi:hypothetical protein
VGLHIDDNYVCMFGDSVVEHHKRVRGNASMGDDFVAGTGLCGRGLGYMCNEPDMSKDSWVAANLEFKLFPDLAVPTVAKGAGQNRFPVRLFLVARRNIRAGEVGTLYYGTNFCRKDYVRRCRCPNFGCKPATPHTCVVADNIEKVCVECKAQKDLIAEGINPYNILQ